MKYTTDQPSLGFMMPTTDWVPPTELPDLVGMGVHEVALDLETCDHGLQAAHGSGWATAQGFLCGVAAAWEGGALYAPLRHADSACLPSELVLGWVAGLVKAGTRIVTQYGSYDWGWLGTMGVPAPTLEGQLDDTHAMAVMLDENRPKYNLDALARWQGLPGKDRNIVAEAGTAMGYKDYMSHLADIPARYVGPYAEQDARLTLALAHKFRPQLAADRLVEAYRTEADLIPMMVAMRRRGIRIDTAMTERNIDKLMQLRDEALDVVSGYARKNLGRPAEIKDIQSPVSLARMLSDEGIKAAHQTEKGKDSFTSKWLDTVDHPLPKAIAAAKTYQMTADKFLQGFILDYCHRGRLHAEINQLRDDDEDGGMVGTRSYRLSYSDPPLQQMPNPKRGKTAVAKNIARLVRQSFLPEEGEEYGKIDYAQQEYRLIVHYAAVQGCTRAEEAAELYRASPRTDFHQLVADWTGLDRKSEAKDANFAKAFGAGIPKFAAMIRASEERAKEIMTQYDKEFPFVSELAKECSGLAERRGFIRLIDGARCRFDLWECKWLPKDKKRGMPESLEDARRRIANPSDDWFGATLRRGFSHKAMNRLIQGSAARQMKIAMRNMWREGILPLLQLHDELGFSTPTDHATLRRARELMETAVTLRVPVLADAETGPNWGDASVPLPR